MDYKIDYDAEYWDVVGNRKFTCYSEEDARWLCDFLNNEEQLAKAIYEMCGINIPYHAYGDNDAACEFAKQITHIREFIAHEILNQ